MSFQPQHLAPTVYEIYKKGKGYWLLAVTSAINIGYEDLNLLTNIAFFMHHPELNNRPLKKDELVLIAEWKSFRTSVIALLAQSKIASSKVPPTSAPNLPAHNSSEYVDEYFPPGY